MFTSARSDSSLSPQAWRFVFSDPGTSGNCRVVTVAAKASSEHPDTVEAFSTIKEDASASIHAVGQAKLAVDSDKALAQVRGAAKLKGIVSAQYRLSQQRSSAESLWMLSLYADEGDAPVARIQVGAKTGSVKIINADN